MNTTKKPSNVIRYNLDTGSFEEPTLLLRTRSGNKIGILQYVNFKFSFVGKGLDEISFEVHKIANNEECPFWDKICNLSIIEYQDYGLFEATVSLNEEDEDIKTVTCQSLETELGQRILREFHVNDEEDYIRTDYNSTYLYKEDSPEYSLLNRAIAEKAPQWSIDYVSPLFNINGKVYEANSLQRTFTVDGTSIYDFFDGDVSKEFNCLFTYDTYNRKISCWNIKECVYNKDTKEVLDGAYECDGVFYNKDNEIISDSTYALCDGIGEDSHIILSRRKLAKNFSIDGDKDSIKNCFYVTGGDDTITNYVAAANITGNYILLFNNFQYEDMSENLSTKLKEYADSLSTAYNAYNRAGGTYIYDSSCTYDVASKTCRKSDGTVITDAIYENEKVYVLDTLAYKITSYIGKGVLDVLICKDIYYDKYDFKIGESEEYSSPFSVDTNSSSTNGNIVYKVGGLYTKYCQENDRFNYLQDAKFPNTELPSATAITVLQSIEDYFSNATNTVMIRNESNSTSFVNVTSTVKTMFETICDTRYKVEILSDETHPQSCTTINENTPTGTWTGYIKITKETDTSDATTSDLLSIPIKYIDTDADERAYLRQRINIEIAKSSVAELDFTQLTDAEILDLFNHYNVTSLKSFIDAINGCISMLQNLYNNLTTNSTTVSSAYTTCSDEWKNYLSLCTTAYDKASTNLDRINSNLTQLDTRIENYKKDWNLQNRLTADEWKELQSYIREDEYNNQNYISDGATSSECVLKAKELLAVANKELQKACVSQKKITGDINNIFSLEQLSSLHDSFALYNYVRAEIDGQIYKLRLTQIDYDSNDTTSLDTTFSEEIESVNQDIDDLQSLLSQTNSIATSYSSTMLQAEQGVNAFDEITGIKQQGLNSADYLVKSSDDEEVTFSRSGILCKSMNDVGMYGDCQLKVIGNGMYLTDDGWRTDPKMAIGRIKHNDVWQYGVVADTIVGKLIVGESLEIEDDNGYVKINGNGISINGGSLNLTNGNYSVEIDPNHEDSNTKNGYLMCIRNGEDILMGVDTDGYGYFKGGLEAGGVSIGRTGNFYGEFYPTTEQGCGLILNFYPPNVFNSSLYDCYLSIKNGIGELENDRGIKFVNKYLSNNYGVDLSINENKIEYNTLNWNRKDLTTKATFTDKSICFDCKTNSGTNINSINVKSLIPEICLSVENSSVNEARTISMNCTQNKIYINNSKYQSNPIGIKGALVGDGNKEAFFIHGKDVSTNHYHSSGSLSNGQGKSISVETNKMYFIITQSWVSGSAFGMFAIMPTSGNYVTTIQSADGVSITTSNANTIDIQNTGVPSVAYKIIEIDFYL